MTALATRVRQLEERITYLEDLLESLNTVVSEQADQLESLRDAASKRPVDEQPIGPALDPPPHY